jgi:hypothetical protein
MDGLKPKKEAAERAAQREVPTLIGHLADLDTAGGDIADAFAEDALAFAGRGAVIVAPSINRFRRRVHKSAPWCPLPPRVEVPKRESRAPLKPWSVRGQVTVPASVTRTRLLQTSIAGRLPSQTPMGSKSQSPSQTPMGSRKPRKKARPPQAISPETWKAVEMAICIGNLGFSECGNQFQISPHAIMMRAKRHGWALPSMIQKRVEALQKSVTERAVCEDYRNGNAEVIEAVAQSWSERGEAHRALVYGLTNAALKKVAKAPPPLESWSDIEKADRAGRRACGLDDSEAARNVSVGMQLIEFRLANIHLPPDAPEAGIVHGQDVTDARL